MVSFSCRVQGDKDDSSEKNNSNCLEITSSLKEEAECDEPKYHDSIEFNDAEDEGEGTPKFFFKFKFQTYEEFSKSNKGNWDFVPSTSKYEFTSDKYLSGFIEEPKDLNFTVKELYADSKNDSFANQMITNEAFLCEKDFKQENSGEETVNEEEPENSMSNTCKEEVAKKAEESIFSEVSKQTVGEGKNQQICDDNSGVKEFLSEKDFVALDSDSDSIASSNEFSFMSHFIAPTSDRFLSDRDFEEAFEPDNMKPTGGGDLESFENEDDDFDDEDKDIIEELEKLEESNVNVSTTQGSEMLSENDFHAKKVSKTEEFGDSNNFDKSNMQNSSASVESEDTNGLETLWEHQDLIEQLQMELKKVRAIGLPTILEESESPKIMEDLKPWKIDEKFQHEDRMGELHKFYRSYRERMRKFDILNYQKMYAIGQLILSLVAKNIISATIFVGLFFGFCAYFCLLSSGVLINSVHY